MDRGGIDFCSDPSRLPSGPLRGLCVERYRLCDPAGASLPSRTVADLVRGRGNPAVLSPSAQRLLAGASLLGRPCERLPSGQRSPSCRVRLALLPDPAPLVRSGGMARGPCVCAPSG